MVHECCDYLSPLRLLRHAGVECVDDISVQVRARIKQSLNISKLLLSKERLRKPVSDPLSRLRRALFKIMYEFANVLAVAGDGEARFSGRLHGALERFPPFLEVKFPREIQMKQRCTGIDDHSMTLLRFRLAHVFDRNVNNLNCLYLAAGARRVTLLAHDVEVDSVHLEQWWYLRFVEYARIVQIVVVVQWSTRDEEEPTILKVLELTRTPLIDEAVDEARPP